MNKFNGLYRKSILLAMVGGIITVLDQVTKKILTSRMALYDSIEIIENFFSLTYLRNPGGAFGIFADQSSRVRFYFFIVFSILAVFVFIYIYFKAPPSDLLLQTSLTFIIGGAAGNIIDRVRLGEVVDFLDFYIGKYHWPPFNVADSAITIGMCLFILHSFKDRSKKIEEPVSN